MKKTALPIVINITRDRLSLCSSTHLEPLIFKFTSAMISDLEVVSSPELTAGLRGFVEANKIKPSTLVLILSQSVYFEKNYPGSNPPSSQDIEEFDDTIPFFATSSKLFKVISGYKQVVINRDFYECFREAFEELGFQVMAVVPSFALGQNANADFNAETCRIIYKKMDQIVVDSLIGAREESFHQKERAYLEKNKVIVVIGVLIILIILVVTAYRTLKKPKVVHTSVATPVMAYPTSVPLLSPTPGISSPSAELLDRLTVQILNSTGVTGQAASLSALIKSSGFTKVQTGNTSQVSPRTLITVSPLAATSAADYVSHLVSSLYPDYSLEHNTQAVNDITIIIGKTTP
jgi:hypothetical protein